MPCRSGPALGSVDQVGDIDTYTAALAGTQTAAEACERLSAVGCAAVVQGESVVIDDGAVTSSPFEGVNKIGDAFYLWCLHDRGGELSRCVPRGPQGSCPPRH